MKTKEIVEILKENRKFLISSHQNLEGDAVGSQLALAELLKKMGKKVILLSPEAVPETYKFLPGIKSIKNAVRGERFDYDVACVVDCTDLDRIGYIKNIINLKKPLINIDHHISNTYFGTINWVEPDASCTGEQIYHLFKEAGIHINKNAALYIYVATLTDTGSFRYANTTAETHKIVAELIAKGLNPTQIYRKIYEEAHRSRLVLLSTVLSTLNITRDGKVAWIRITKDMLRKHKTGMRGTEDFINFPRSIKGVRIAIAFREIGKDIIRVSFRSNEGVDVCKLAKHFDGGGHPSASACTLKVNMPEAEEAVLVKAKRYLRKGQKNRARHEFLG